MKRTLLSLVLATAIGIEAGAATREASLALEDAAFQAAMRMDGDVRVTGHIKRIAFVKLWGAGTDGDSFALGGGNTATIESALGAVPCSFDFVLHSSRDEQWTQIDQVFDQAADFDDYNPATHPGLKQFALCDGLLLAKLVDGRADSETGEASARVAFKLVEVATATVAWSGVVEGRYDPPGPEEGELNPQARAAMTDAASKIVAALPGTLKGYEIYVLPLEGRGGRSMTQLLFSALSKAGRQDEIRLHDLPTNTAEDRALARYLRECGVAGAAVDSSVLRSLENRAGRGDSPAKVALLTGLVSLGRVYPETMVDPTGKAIDKLTGSLTAARENVTLFEVNADVKMRDVSDGFRVLAAASETGLWRREVVSDIWEQLRALATLRNCLLLLGALVALGILSAVFKQMTHVR